MEAGVHLSTVQYWRDADKWDERLRQALDKAAQQDPGNIVVPLLQTSLIAHIKSLNKIIKNAKDADRIKAIREFVGMYRMLQIPLPRSADSPTETAEFNDNLELSP